MTDTALSTSIKALARREELDPARLEAAFDTLLAGEAQPEQVGAFLMGLAVRGETSTELLAGARTMRRHARRIDISGPLLDTCGTGGDGADTFNVSTVSALVVAAAGTPVAKHGNRSASSRCGSADLLEAWGIALDLSPAAVATCVRELGIGFLFARTFHPAMRHVGPIRASLGIRTVFNVLGPLSNPAGATHQIVGVSDVRLAPVMADALARLGKTHALVFCGTDGLDELTTTGPSRMWEVRDGEVTASTFDPTEVGITIARLPDLQGGDVPENVEIADAVLAGQPGPPADIVALNAGAALYAADAVTSIADGVERAREVLASGDAGTLRDRWAARTRELAG